MLVPHSEMGFRGRRVSLSCLLASWRCQFPLSVTVLEVEVFVTIRGRGRPMRASEMSLLTEKRRGLNIKPQDVRDWVEEESPLPGWLGVSGLR